MDKCKTCGSDEISVGITNITSGATVFPYYCKKCGEVFQQYVKKAKAHEYARQNGPLQYVQTRTAKYMEKKQKQIQCEVCKTPEGELHHWAPAHIFAEECERWPTSYLCRACHHRWHRLVTPNMSHKPGAFAMAYQPEGQ